jgi:trigger factor
VPLGTEKMKGLSVNVTVENLAACKKLLRVEVESEKVKETFESVTKDFQRQASLPGFRPGKAPKDMVVRRFESQIQEEVKTKLTRESYQNAVREQKLAVVGYPDIEEIQFGRDQSYQFAATIETAPDIDLPEYKGLPVKRQLATITDADVDRAIMMLRERQVKYETVTREVRENDVAVVNYQGTCEGKAITELAPAARGLTDQKNFWVHIHQGSFIPGFAEQLIGAKTGDHRTVKVDFAADFVTPELQGKKGSYEVDIVEVKEKLVPEFNDEFAKSFGAESADKMKARVREDLENEVKQKQERNVRDQIVQGLLNQVQCELPESAVAAETRQVVYNIVNENQRRGIPTEAIEAEKDQIFASASLAAKDRVKAAFLFGKIADKEKIKVEQQEVVQRIQAMSAMYQIPAEKLVKDLQKRDGIPEIYDQLLNEKVVNFLVENAKIEDVPPAPQPQA